MPFCAEIDNLSIANQGGVLIAICWQPDPDLLAT
jgi:hypothetical protein